MAGLEYSSLNSGGFYLFGTLWYASIWEGATCYKIYEECVQYKTFHARHVLVWDPQQVLGMLAKLDVSEINLLTKKCTALMALVTSQRASSLQAIKLPDIQFVTEIE